MSGGTHTTRARASVPDIGLWVPTASLHIAFLVVATGLCLLALESPLWLGIGLLLAIAGTVMSQRVPTWWLLLVLGLSQLWREPAATDFVFYLLLAGVHLLYVLGGLARLLPVDGRMQLAAFVRPLLRFVLVQTVAQSVAIGALLVFGGGAGIVPSLSLLAAVVLAIIAALIARGLGQAHARR